MQYGLVPEMRVVGSEEAIDDFPTSDLLRGAQRYSAGEGFAVSGLSGLTSNLLFHYAPEPR